MAFDAPWSEGEFRDLLNSAGVLALLDDDGFMLLRALADEAEILTLAVAPAARGRGLGRALVEAGAQAAAAAGAETLFLEVAADNAPALPLYAAAGFERVGERRGYYPRPGGAAADAYTLRRALSPSPP
jgi:ribosomal-protein-alanine N-acetyltransferase